MKNSRTSTSSNEENVVRIIKVKDMMEFTIDVIGVEESLKTFQTVKGRLDTR